MEPHVPGHPTTDELRAFGDGRLPAAAAAAVEAHLGICDSCCRVLEVAPADEFLNRLRAINVPGGMPAARRVQTAAEDSASALGESPTTALPHLAVTEPSDPFPIREPDPFATRDPNAVAIESSTRDGEFPPDTQLDGDLSGDVAGFRILGELARGGMGVVYRAHDLALNRTVAVKVLQHKYRDRPAAAARFLEEAQLTAQLQHPGIPPVHQIGTLPDGRPFLAMKLITGRTLADLLTDPSWDRSQAIGTFEQICRTVAYAHDHGVIHRDLKPGNVMVGRFNEVQVLDWGLAKLRTATQEPTAATFEASTFHDPRGERSGDFGTVAGSALGTPDYMPPEQALGVVGQMTERSDVFGLGAVLCAVLTGKAPYIGKDAESIRLLAARAKLDDAYARLDASGADPELVALCRRCLSPEPADRPANAGEVAKAVARLRTAAEHSARQADLDRVRAEGERAKAEAEARDQRERRRVQLALIRPAPSGWRETVRRYPILSIFGVAFLPNSLASEFNTTYNLREICKGWPVDAVTFGTVASAVNGLVFPVGVCILGLTIWPVRQGLRRLRAGTSIDPSDLERRRLRALRLGHLTAVICVAGWLATGLVMPIILTSKVGPPQPGTGLYLHFLAWVVVGGLMALTYSYFLVMYGTVRALYPALFGPGGPGPADGPALRRVGRELSLYRMLAAAIPLAAVGVLAGAGASNTPTVVVLCVTGGAGSVVVYVLDGRMRTDLEALAALAAVPGTE